LCGSEGTAGETERDLNSCSLDCPDATYGSSDRKPGHHDIAHLVHHVRPVKIGPGKLAIEKCKVRSSREHHQHQDHKDDKKDEPVHDAPNAEPEAARILRLGN
jgi:hypothetical protein